MKQNSEVYPPNIHATTLPLKKAFAIKKNESLFVSSLCLQTSFEK
jgi:hypothetical protein